ncbi:MAG: hypothetical protein M1830_008903 [Pleopsidium flavum]|nr:MAG: hypothetical protein M1830_008903 [Pleopsidium flavum]
MSRDPLVSKQSSRWGSFLQQAVAGVESRLDTILADGDETPATPVKANGKRHEQSISGDTTGLPGPARARADNLTRSASTGRNNDRFQERLAKAMVKSNSTARSDSPASASEISSRNAGSPRTSLDIQVEDVETAHNTPSHHVSRAFEEAAEIVAEGTTEAGDGKLQRSYLNPTTTLPTSPELTFVSRPSVEFRSEVSSRQSLENARHDGLSDKNDISSFLAEGPSYAQKSSKEYEAMIAEMQSDHEVSELRRQEETHTFIERIDALQSRLQYLTKEAAHSAKTAISAAPAGTLDRRLAEKDEQIALLMEEGQKLSQAELRHMNTIKKLRTTILEDERRAAQARKKTEQAEHNMQIAREKTKRLEVAERREFEKIITVSRMEKEYQSLKAELDSLSATAADLRVQLAHATSKAKAAESKAQTDALDAERKSSAKLRDDLSRERVERELSEGKLRSEVHAIQEEAERERERARVTETELRGEQSMLENKLEVLHARAEEVSTGATGDAQTKLLRQIELLQTQYTTASDNWQGIEGSLLSRIKGLEEERDEKTKRQGDIRRRVRDLNIRVKTADEELDVALGKLHDTQLEFAEQSEELKISQERLRLSEATLAIMREEFEKERASWETTLARRIGDERSKWRQETTPTPPIASQQFRTRSPGPYTRKVSSADLLSLQNRRHHTQAELVYVANSAPDPPPSRHASGQPLRTPDVGTLQRQDSSPTMTQQPVNGTFPNTPSVQMSDHDDFFAGARSSASPHRTINDMISVSTAGAGPSIQLVERMSAAVRRLESEKAASKDELVRLSTQRDEAREQVVSLMYEVEQKRAADIRLKSLEEEISQINERYQTTLEMLGEKSELVEELKADVADVKKIYRELVDSTMR